MQVKYPISPAWFFPYFFRAKVRASLPQPSWCLISWSQCHYWFRGHTFFPGTTLSSVLRGCSWWCLGEHVVFKSGSPAYRADCYLSVSTLLHLHKVLFIVFKHHFEMPSCLFYLNQWFPDFRIIWISKICKTNYENQNRMFGQINNLKSWFLLLAIFQNN